jgi:hypothetical protein
MMGSVLRYILFTVVLYPVLLYSQGSISGTIKDKKTNEIIVGASVYTLGTTTGAFSDIEGNYTISNVKSGVHDIVISYISYQSDTLRNIRVTNGKVTHLDIELTETVTQLSEVNVTARRKIDTDISVISTAKQSNLIIVGISSQMISKSQDKDASEVIRRVPGVTIIDGRFVVVRGLIERYNSVQLNNATTPSSETDQRAFSFDVLPSNMISNMLIFKTPAPEIPAEFAGAFIQITTKNLPSENSISVGYTGSYNQNTSFEKFEQYQGGKNDWLGYDDGTRNLPGIVPSTQEMLILQDYNNGTPEEIRYKKQMVMDIAHSFSETSSSSPISAPLDNKFNIDLTQLYNIGKAKLGNITAMSYRLGYNTLNIYRATVQDYGGTTTGITYSKQYKDMRYAESVAIGVICNWSLSIGKSMYEFGNLLNQFGLSSTTIRNGVDHYRDDNLVYKTQLYYASRTIYTGTIGGSHKFNSDNSNLNWTAGYSYANMNEPDNRLISYNAPKMTDSSYYPYQLEYSSTVNIDANARLFSNVRENIFNGSINYNHIFLFGNFTPEFKAGFFAENREREFRIRPFGIIWAKPGVFNQEILHQPIDSVYYPGNFNFVDGVVYREDYKTSYKYRVKNTLLAGYLSLRIPLFNFINIYGGLRAEKYKMNLSGPSSTPEYVTKVRRDTLTLFPSINVTFNITEKHLFRLAYGKTINRPEYREIAPFSFYEFKENVIVYGNDSLQSCRINNFDFRYEFYPTPGELITIGGFYKDFKNPIEATWIPASSGEWDLRFINANHAWSLGAEIDIRKNFRSWSSKGGFLKTFKDFTVILNASIIKSRVETDLLYVRDKNRPMYGQSPFIVNAGLYYQNDKINLSVSLLYNIFGKRIVGIGTPDIPNSYEMPRNAMDFTIIKLFAKSFQVKFGIKDIFNEPVLIEQLMKSELSDETARITVKSFKPGRSFSLGFSYIIKYNQNK